MKISTRQHTLFWLAYFLWDVLQAVVAISMSPGRTFSTEIMPALGTTFLTMPVKMALFYLLFRFTLKPLLLRPKYTGHPLVLAFGVTLLFLFMLRVLIFYIVFPVFYHADMSSASFFNLSSLVITLFDLVIPACLLMIYELYRFTHLSRERESRLEKEKLVSELSFLKAQINPHFLFNVLSTVHALSRQKAPEAADVTLKLSQLMRFMLYGANREKISVAEETKFLDDYIELEKVRFRNKLTVQFGKNIDDPSQQIAPLILLPFVENAFKYAAGESRMNSHVNIILTVESGTLCFEVENSVETSPHSGSGTGIGLANIKRQLELLYPEHELILEKREHSFFASVKLKLQGHEEV
ncbi:MAG TPA: histidine kinase [Chitinophagaceae bacterium]|jgi:sensor histidine kinase YesM|nr:histidine kinase [Chitinophagaceae bacterium]